MYTYWKSSDNCTNKLQYSALGQGKAGTTLTLNHDTSYIISIVHMWGMSGEMRLKNNGTQISLGTAISSHHAGGSQGAEVFLTTGDFKKGDVLTLATTGNVYQLSLIAP